MRLHSLSMTAIGPYVDNQRIDFDALADDGLFLFTGPTGAGKSTVLDAVTYALYGKLPGNRDGHLSRLKSDFAAPQQTPEVVLEVTVAAERLRIRRTPAFDRPSKRNPHKVTTQRSTVAVERWVDGAWLGVEGARTEQVANQWLHEKIGLNADQFTQVVLLPQGQFAEFLHANDDVREKLLTSLFDAHRFKEVESWFEERQRAEAALAAEADERVRTLRTRAQTIADLGDGDLPEVVDVAYFEDLAVRHQTAANETAVALEVAKRLRDEAEHRVRDAEAITGLLAERADARALRETVESRRAEMIELRERVEQASAAAPIAPLIAARDERAKTETRAEIALCAARDALGAQVPDTAALTADLSDARARVRALTAERGALNEQVSAERSLSTRERELVEAESQSQRAAADVSALKQTQAELPALRDAAFSRITDLRERAAILDDAQAAVVELTRALSAANEGAQLRPRLREAEDFVRDKRDGVLGAREYLSDLRDKRIAGMAAEIASGLRAGEACAVCGSTTHPQPARPADDAPSVEQIELAEAKVEQARHVLSAAESSAAEHREKIAAAQAIADGREADELTELLANAVARRDGAAAAAEELPQAQSALRLIEDEIAEGERRLAEAIAYADELSAVHREAADDLERCRNSVEQARAGYESVAERVAGIDTEIELIEAYVNAHVTYDAAQAELAAATQAASAAANREGFCSVEEALAASMGKEALVAAREQIAAFERDDASAQTRLSDPRLAELPDTAPDVETLRAAADDARSAEEAARDAHTMQADRRDRLTDLSTQARGDVADALATSARAAEVRELALLVRGLGANSKKMNLTAYFLAARLEQVSEVASEHLRVMSSGRYTLRHTDVRRTARGHGGLGLEVFDAFTGKPRPPHSLSGGETFVASLALALGLAEVVTAETGAMTLDSLFIDEGFGSLDPDTLDQAMSVLDGLRQVGRTIGVISHVEEMRTRITNQLVIERTDQGSRVLPH
ncbi:AAA family ATPase [Cumulibacter soli]|uniref:AAA family ATPase n=1 Tax=Cumulibacter soli TaxID=2546344 RepID=UPI0010682F71|nr:AAA family ATPase [Cumulibacter soli]